ncbi:IucA/IucC family protein [Micromonospora sp. HUAS LYJ1]|uniref:IucA/IucC family protein n=1 Tax=Micromonospora sp. HUAS LYJ1 TaxID=3061626 RepID=UPI002672FF83|nr:IucA/IucC family protein [Micromonospora sp. HUAS LYJ1]WKU07136.1 IucA/IucC family protein [Micromonospora sp. HUAS LYJ1]
MERVTPAGEATERVLTDLVDTLLAEEFWVPSELRLDSLTQWTAFAGEDATLTALTRTWEAQARALEGTARDVLAVCSWWSESTNSQVCFPVRPAFVQPFRYLTNGGVHAIRRDVGAGSGAVVDTLDPVRLMELVVASCLASDKRDHPGVRQFLALLDETVRQLSWSLDNDIPGQDVLSLSPAAFFRKVEQYASVRDRPFHPVAKAKTGLREPEYRRYLGEFGHDVELRWVAVERARVIAGSAAGAADRGSTPAELLLSGEERGALMREMTDRGLSTDRFLALPVHPWQVDVVLAHLPLAFASGACVPLRTVAGTFQVTSSVRSLAPSDDDRNHVKLPLGIASLGALRNLPAVKLMNGERGQALLCQARVRDEVLEQRLFLCEETTWWGYLPDGGSLFDAPPRHLAAMVRTYPQELVADTGVRLVPMSALSTEITGPDRHLFDAGMRARGTAVSAAGAIALFTEVCDTFFDISLRLYRIGLLPEIHGQNCVLVWKHGRVAGMLLRDHDSVRLHLPWLERHGIGDPHYRIRPGHSNTLYNETPASLLFYLQTLGIQVNLRSVIETLAATYSVAERTLWIAMRDSLREAVETVPFDTDVRTQTTETLLTSTTWPLKLLVKPLLEQEGFSGSMPSGKAVTQNPFRHLDD